MQALRQAIRIQALDAVAAVEANKRPMDATLEPTKPNLRSRRRRAGRLVRVVRTPSAGRMDENFPRLPRSRVGLVGTSDIGKATLWSSNPTAMMRGPGSIRPPQTAALSTATK